MWQEIDNSLQKEFSFKNFTQAWAWMTQVAIEAEKADHHPEWTNVYNKVNVKLSTHDAGNIVTENDRKLAKIMDSAFENFKAK